MISEDSPIRECEHCSKAKPGEKVYFCLPHFVRMCRSCASSHALLSHISDLVAMKEIDPLRLYDYED